MSFHRHLTVITKAQEDSTIINTYPTTIKPINQATKGDVRDYLGEKSVYTLLVEGQHAYVHDCQAKTDVYVSKHSQDKEKAKKLKIRMNRCCQAVIWQETQYKREQSKEKNTPNPKKEDFIPSMVTNSVTRKISLWLGVNHNKWK
jgi:hypothetical protein